MVYSHTLAASSSRARPLVPRLLAHLVYQCTLSHLPQPVDLTYATGAAAGEGWQEAAPFQAM
jgi:hypothetical protein